MLCATVPCSRTAWSPVAVTTTASRPTATCARTTSCSAAPPAGTATACVTDPYPMNATRIVAAPAGTLTRRYRPSCPVNARSVVPTTETCAPATDWPDVLSVTRPVTSPCCAASSGTNVSMPSATATPSPVLPIVNRIVAFLTGGFTYHANGVMDSPDRRSADRVAAQPALRQPSDYIGRG